MKRNTFLKIIPLFLIVFALVFSTYILLNSKVQTNYSGNGMEYSEKLFTNNHIAEININISQDSWNYMIENALKEEYTKCDITINGETFYNVGIRPKGNTSLSQVVSNPNSDRYSFKIKFDKYIDGQNYYGLNSFVLENLILVFLITIYL